MQILPTMQMLIADNSDADLVDSDAEMADSDVDYEDNADDN